MQPTNSIVSLIETALAGGYSRARLIELAECSRMQFWRLQNGHSGPNSKAGRKLQAALASTTDASLETVLAQLSQKLANATPARQADAIQMLHAVTRLLS